MHMPMGVGQSLMATSPTGGSIGQQQRVGQHVTAAAGSLALTAGPVSAAAQADAMRGIELARRTAVHGATQTQLTLQADAAAAQEVLKRHKLGALLRECDRCGTDPATLYLPKLAAMADAV